MATLLKRYAGNESGATAIEYGLIAGIISVVCIATLTTVGTYLKSNFNYVGTKIGSKG